MLEERPCLVVVGEGSPWRSAASTHLPRTDGEYAFESAKGRFTVQLREW